MVPGLHVERTIAFVEWWDVRLLRSIVITDHIFYSYDYLCLENFCFLSVVSVIIPCIHCLLWNNAQFLYFIFIKLFFCKIHDSCNPQIILIQLDCLCFYKLHFYLPFEISYLAFTNVIMVSSSYLFTRSYFLCVFSFVLISFSASQSIHLVYTY